MSGLGPPAQRPIGADLDADPPLIAMSQVPGEHITLWAYAGIHAEAFLDRLNLNSGERQQITQLRRLFAAFWVMRLLPGGSAYHRNPSGTL